MHLVLIIGFAFFGIAQCKLLDLSCQNVRQFVNGHNLRRMKLAQGKVAGQPAASEMKLMVWDEELAIKAGRWANRNQRIHNPDKTIRSGRFRTGENIYWYDTTAKNHKFDLDMALKSWWDENQLWQFGKLTNNDFAGGKKEIGHYTQMAWSNSNRVGCAISQTFKNEWTKYFVVCNYGPAGNYIRQTPYETGAPSKALRCHGDDCKYQYGERCSLV